MTMFGGVCEFCFFFRRGALCCANQLLGVTCAVMLLPYAVALLP